MSITNIWYRQTKSRNFVAYKRFVTHCTTSVNRYFQFFFVFFSSIWWRQRARWNKRVKQQENLWKEMSYRQLGFALVIVFVCHIHLCLQFLRLFMPFPIDITYRLSETILTFTVIPDTKVAMLCYFCSSIFHRKMLHQFFVIVLLVLIHILIFPSLVKYYRTHIFM